MIQIVLQAPQHADQRFERSRDLVFVGGADVLPDVRRTRREPCRVNQTASRKLQPFSADRFADDLHQRARGELRQMAQKRQHPIVSLCVHHLRLRAERFRKGQQLVERLAAAVAARGEQPRAAFEQIGTRVFESAVRSPRQRMSANEGQSRGQPPCGFEHRPLRAAGVRHDSRLADVLVELVDELEILTHRRGEDDEIRFGKDNRIIGRHVNRMQAHRRFEDVLVVDGYDERRRPDLARGKRDRSADQPETDDADVAKDRSLTGSGRSPSRLDNRKFQRTAPSLPSPCARPSRGRCCGR